MIWKIESDLNVSQLKNKLWDEKNQDFLYIKNLIILMYQFNPKQGFLYSSYVFWLAGFTDQLAQNKYPERGL